MLNRRVQRGELDVKEAQRIFNNVVEGKTSVDDALKRLNISLLTSIAIYIGTCFSPMSSKDAVSECLHKVYYSLVKTNVGLLVPVEYAQCLAAIKLALIMVARTTGDDLDYAFSNWSFHVGRISAWCRPAFMRC